MKRHRIITLVLLIMLLTTTIQFKQRFSQYIGKVTFLTENPTAAIVCFATALVKKDNKKAGYKWFEVIS